jgi:hypothetical protein
MDGTPTSVSEGSRFAREGQRSVREGSHCHYRTRLHPYEIPSHFTTPPQIYVTDSNTKLAAMTGDSGGEDAGRPDGPVVGNSG